MFLTTGQGVTRSRAIAHVRITCLSTSPSGLTGQSRYGCIKTFYDFFP
ncbi:hypothetical protein R69919_01096 [Paraburkholderia gardini]|uniref:Uncharacterized protein n=1 Tax=Paraburkholderia gardini TaxID=2823469 RepID=A0ABM8TY60_9BURK|nr:hypothetical protein R54767_00431 [Paraburkholderia gardini]CAG4891105.1 hypothetical protein R69919_01096 [Paraburkholderia gardini]